MASSQFSTSVSLSEAQKVVELQVERKPRKLCNRRLARKGGAWNGQTLSKAGERLFELLKRPCWESGSMSQILHVYLSSATLSDGERTSTSRVCQQMLWQLAAAGKGSDEVLVFSDHVVQLATDPHWNFLLQHLVTLCTAAQLEVFCARLSGRALELSKHCIGCRLLCRVCEQGKFLEGARRLLEELANDISELIVHRYGNFVVMKIMENFENFSGVDEALMTCVVGRCRL